MFTKRDHQLMGRAIELAKRGLFSADPNPRVGCVIVRGDSASGGSIAKVSNESLRVDTVEGDWEGGKFEQDDILGEGWHEVTGRGHAERRALDHVETELKADVKGSTVYVTLEPCSYHGRTPACIDALIEACVGKVIVAMVDPNPLVAGKGIEALRQAGIECLVGLRAEEARQLNLGFIHRMTLKRPWITIKLAMSMDGRTAMASGESQWITGSEARLDVQRLRARSSAIITGVNTVIDDDAALTVRVEDWSQPYFSDDATLLKVRQPKRIVLDSTLRTPVHARILKQAGQTTIVGSEKALLNVPSVLDRQKRLQQLGAEVLMMSDYHNRVDIKNLLSKLAEDECNEVLVEAGATLAGNFFQQNLWDELVVYMAPKLMGNLARPLLMLPLDTMSQVESFQWNDITQVGTDMRLTILKS